VFVYIAALLTSVVLGFDSRFHSTIVVGHRDTIIKYDEISSSEDACSSVNVGAFIFRVNVLSMYLLFAFRYIIH